MNSLKAMYGCGLNFFIKLAYNSLFLYKFANNVISCTNKLKAHSNMITKEELFSVVDHKNILNDSPNKYLLVNEDLQILYVNFTPIEQDKKFSPGDLLQCHNAVEVKFGCGSHENCKRCKLRAMVTASLHTQKRMESDVEFLLCGNKDCHAHAVCTPFMREGKVYAIVLLVNKTDQQHEFMLERIFIHDILNLSGALNGILECVANENLNEMIPAVRSISNQLLNEIVAQRNFIYAQRGLLKPDNVEFKASEVVEFARQSVVTPAFGFYGVDLEIDSTLTDEVVYTDKTLVNRVVYNMLKNACEANRNTKIVMRGRSTADKVVYSVHNDAIISNEMKNNIFVYGNTTKGHGRGLGTYSMKLIGENYLNGRVWFRSEEGFGTEFYFEIDRKKE